MLVITVWTLCFCAPYVSAYKVIQKWSINAANLPRPFMQLSWVTPMVCGVGASVEIRLIFAQWLFDCQHEKLLQNFDSYVHINRLVFYNFVLVCGDVFHERPIVCASVCKLSDVRPVFVVSNWPHWVPRFALVILTLIIIIYFAQQYKTAVSDINSQRAGQ